MTGIRRVGTTLMMCAGLVVAPTVWAINMQSGQILPYVDCVSKVQTSAFLSLTAVLLTLVSGALSWRSISFVKLYTYRFIGGMSALTAGVFAFALALQTVASMVLSGCQR